MPSPLNPQRKRDSQGGADSHRDSVYHHTCWVFAERGERFEVRATLRSAAFASRSSTTSRREPPSLSVAVSRRLWSIPKSSCEFGPGGWWPPSGIWDPTFLEWDL